MPRPLTSVRGIGRATAALLARAGVADVPALLAADPEDLARRSGVPVSRLRALRAAAEDAEREGATDDDLTSVRVVLTPSGARARVFDGKTWRDGLPLVTVRLAEDEDALMAEQRQDAVLLKEGATAAYVRVDGSWLGGVPIFRERARPDGSVDEVRVAVKEVRPRISERRPRGRED